MFSQRLTALEDELREISSEAPRVFPVQRVAATFVRLEPGSRNRREQRVLIAANGIRIAVAPRQQRRDRDGR